MGKRITSSARAETVRNDGSRPPGQETTTVPPEVREHKIGKLVIKIISGIIAVFGLVLAISTNSSGKSAESYILGSGTPTCANPKWLLQVPDSQIAVTAFYYHRPYSADQTIDGNQSTAWLQWWPTTDFGGYRPGDDYIRWDFSRVHSRVRVSRNDTRTVGRNKGGGGLLYGARYGSCSTWHPETPPGWVPSVPPRYYSPGL
jgi:hypothetical protein